MIPNIVIAPFAEVSFKFCAAHRLVGHKGRCRFLHGHNYTATVSVLSPAARLNDLGMVVDFSTLKNVIGGWINENWDHNVILNPADPMLWPWGTTAERGSALYFTEVFAGRAPFVMPADLKNPTAENMALLLAREVATRLPDHPLRGVRVQETDNCAAGADCYTVSQE